MLGGELIYQTSDKYGAIEVVDYLDKIRALHFGNQTQQSASLLCNPFFLIHKYAQAMTLPLCWLDAKNVLVLGLGAGSIVKHLYNYHPDIQIDAVELRPQVTEVAHEYFMLPEADERLTIFHDSAENWLKGTRQSKYDLIIVDVFLTTEFGKDITVDIKHSINSIFNLLSESGVASFNYLGENIKSYSAFTALSDAFKQSLYTINIESTNAILIASRGHVPNRLDRHVFEKMSKISTLPYEEYFNLMKPIL